MLSIYYLVSIVTIVLGDWYYCTHRTDDDSEVRLSYQLLSSQRGGCILEGLRRHSEGEGDSFATPKPSALLCTVMKEHEKKYFPTC